MTASSFGFLILMLVGIVLLLVPGIIANKRKHAFKGVIWALTLFGIVTFGVCWLAALIWAIWPAEKSLVDPFVGNPTGTGSRNAGSSFGENDKSRLASSGQNLESKLSNLDVMRSQGTINDDEYQAMRKNILGI
jgi:hypothetical protein